MTTPEQALRNAVEMIWPGITKESDMARFEPCTPWFPASERPSRKGWYQMRSRGLWAAEAMAGQEPIEDGRRVWARLAHWNGRNWQAGLHILKPSGRTKWRGLKKNYRLA